MRILEERQAPNPRRVRIFLAEKGVSMEYEQVSFMLAAHKSPEFRTKNPMGQLPVLELDDGGFLSESVSICRYFETLYPDPPLMGTPGDALDIARTDMWQRRMEFNLLGPITYCFRHLHPAMKQFQQPQVDEWGHASRDEALETMDWLDKELENRSFIVGERYTIADITALVAVDFARPARINALDGRKHLARWHETVSARESSQA